MINLLDESKLDANGLRRWISNNALVPMFVFKEQGTPAGYDLAAHQIALTAETAAFIADYIAMRERDGYSAEERAEAMHELGLGAIDIVTGKRIN
jgi:hypothetical protein